MAAESSNPGSASRSRTGSANIVPALPAVPMLAALAPKVV
jgi:hypothetical protein